MANAFHVNQRLSYDGNLCTVRYIGGVRNTKGDWLGIEWDDAERGKHSGEHNGMKYFQCALRQPFPASFIRPSRPTDPPRSFTDAVHDKYASELGGRLYDVQFDKSGDFIKISGKNVEEVGFERIRKQLANLMQLRVLVVDTLQIHRPQARCTALDSLGSTDLAETCPDILDLDASRNLFESWSEIVDICKQLRRLTSLRVDGNRFATMRLEGSLEYLARPPFTRIKTLSLSDTLLKWDDVSYVASMFPILSTLSANGNQYQQIPITKLPSSIETLHLERNEVESLAAIEGLQKLNNLRSLSLRENPISRIGLERSTSGFRNGTTFPESLVELNLPYCSIDDWSFIDDLARMFPSLTSLRVAHNPLYDSLTSANGKPLTPDDGYMLTLARLGGLTRLNFSAITAKDRLNAELYYLSQINLELSLVPEEQHQAILVQHPRYSELRQVYDNSEQQVHKAKSDVDPHSLAASLVTVTFKPVEGLAGSMRQDRSIRDRGIWCFEVPKSFSIYRIVGMAAKHYGLTPMSLQLQLECAGDDVLHEASDSDLSSEEEVSNDSARRASQIQEPRQLLSPLMRSLGTWVEGNTATIWITTKYNGEST